MFRSNGRATALYVVLSTFLLGGGPVVGAPPGKLAEPLDVVFTAKLDGTEQRYVVMLPESFERSKTHTALIALHGHGSDRWQFVKQTRGECQAARDAAAKHGLVFVSPDYRASTSWMGPAAEADVLQIIDELRANYGVDRVIISGGSMGGTSALAFAALHPDKVAGVVSLNGTANLVEYPNFSDAITKSYGGTKQDRPEVYQSRSAELHADKLTMPIAITTGGRDQAVPPESCLRLVEKLRKLDRPVHLIHRPEGGHATNHADSLAAFEFVIGKLR
ncbi:MAG: alpha/beta fold hydrolase [Planctomycetaceae bacterium]|nr:alpha/beta fold hydrolase [Planctomycetaceae bacterium]